MNEKNKNEKTFGDLFSNITNNLEKKDNFMSFNDIKDHKESNLEKDSENEQLKEPKLKTLNALTKPRFNMFENSEQKPEEEIKTSSITEDNNKMISNEQKVEVNEIEQEISEIKQNNTNVFKFNPEQKPEEEIKVSSITEDNNKITSNDQKEETKTPETNIFNSSSIFKIKESEVEQKPSNNNITINENKDSSKDLPSEENKLSIFDTPNDNNQQTEKEENKFLLTENNNQNIFFNDNKTEPSNELSQQTIKKIDSNDNNPFFDEKETISSSPFFEEESKPTSTSPFFEEMPKQEQQQNPFFDNKINLDETKTHNLGEKSNKIDTSNAKKFDVKIVKKKEPLLKFIIGVVSYAIFILLLFIGITLLVYIADIKIRAAKGDFTPPKYNAYVVLTGSMLPQIQVYDVVITKKTEPQKLKKDDVITFASSDTRFLNTIITHRIIKKNFDAKTNTYTFQTKGDNNNVADSALVEQNKIYGKVILKIPKLGYLQHFLAQDGGYILVVIIPCLIVISYDIVKLMKGLKRKKYKNIKVQK